VGRRAGLIVRLPLQVANQPLKFLEQLRLIHPLFPFQPATASPAAIHTS
jgi:hypothetical protein